MLIPWPLPIFFQFFFFHSQAEVLFLTELSSTVLYLFKREQHRKGKAKLRGVTKQVLMKLSSFAPYLKAWCFFVVGKIRRATDLFSFRGAECILPAVFNVMFLPASFAQSGMPFDLCLAVLGLFIFQVLAVQVPTFQSVAFAGPPSHCLYTFKILLCVLHPLKLLLMCGFVLLDGMDRDLHSLYLVVSC